MRLGVFVLCEVLACSTVPHLYAHERRAVRHDKAINLFVAPAIKADFAGPEVPHLQKSITAVHAVPVPTMHYTAAGDVVQWWKSATRDASEDHSLPGGTPIWHDPVSGAAIGQFGAAYFQSGPMGTDGIAHQVGHR